MPSGEKSSWTIEEQSWNHLLRHAVANYPKEACGILLSHSEKPRHITEVHPTKNATPENPATRYFVDPLEFLEVDKWAEERELDICGFYHSHPDHPSVPSEYDQKSAWEGYLYLIVSIKGGKFDEATAWIWHPDGKHFKEVIFQSNANESHNE
ncbi:MAG: M67 family metallopeptidase [Deltaproteobacteria bacterium]|nr:MAG: M67 family metallopeptidase [Deltaproteobacteria bacterium]